MPEVEQEPEIASQDVPDEVETSAEATEQPQEALSRGWWVWDAILAIGLLSLIPLLFVHASEMWKVVELRFFPALPVISLVLAAVWGKRGSCESRGRAIIAVVVLVLSAMAAAYGAWKVAPWFGLLSAALLWLSWMLARLGRSPWYRATGWLMPVFLLLAFPTATTYDMSETMESEVLASSSGVLDMLSIPHLPIESGITTQNARVPVAKVSRGISNPYLLLTLSLLLLMFTQRSFMIGVLSMATVPLWAWLASSAYLTAGLYMLEEKQIVLFTEERAPWIQAGLVLLSLLFVWLSSVALGSLFAPFQVYSSTTNDVHKFYNRLTYWPEPDPDRKRKPDDDEEDEWSAVEFWESRTVRIFLSCAALIMVAGGGYAGFQIFGI